MNWFRRSPKHAANAVLSACGGGLGAVRLEPGADRPRLAAFALRDAPVISPDLLHRMAGEHGLRDLPLTCLLAAEDYQTVMVESPQVAEDELRTALRWKVKDLISFHIDDAVLDHLALPTLPGRAANTWVVAAKSAAVRALAEEYRQAGLDLRVIDIRETAQRNLTALLAPDDYAVAMLHMDGQDSLLTFNQGGELLLSRRIEGRGAAQEQLLDRVGLETQRSVDYFERQFHTLPLAKLYLAPMPEQGRWRDYLAGQLTIPVEGVDLARFVDLTGHDRLNDPRLQNQVFHLVGAALRGILG
jgi:MSHA biogenesis protein MshI